MQLKFDGNNIKINSLVSVNIFALAVMRSLFGYLIDFRSMLFVVHVYQFKTGSRDNYQKDRLNVHQEGCFNFCR